MKLPNVEKAMEGKGDGSTAKELISPAPTTAKAGCAKLNTSIDL